MDIKLIAMDLDGTALREDKSISPRLLHDLEAASARGVYVVPVTGRQPTMLPPFLPAPWTKFAVLCNGSEVRALPGGELIAAHHMSPEMLTEHLPAFLKLGLIVELSGGGELSTTAEMMDELFALPIHPFHHATLREHGRVVENLWDFIASVPYPFDKINLPHVPPEKQDALMALLPSLPFSGVWSGPTSMEVTHGEATKGKGLLTVCRHLGIDPKHTMAIGDSGNDIPMLSVAGLSVAMGNAPDFVKAAARTVTLSNEEDGVAVAVEKYVLNG